MRICHSVYLSLVFFSLCSPISAQDLPDSTWINWRLVGPQTDFPEPSLTIYPAYYGAVGDGMADDTEAILQALEACGGSPCNVILGEGTFRINSSLSLSSHQHIVGKGSEKTLLLFEMGNNPAACIQMIGENGPAYDVPTYTPKKSHLIHFPEMIEIEEGDYLEFFEPNQSWDSSPADWAAESVGQILQVREVLADGRIETVEDLRFSLDPEHATKVRRIFPVQNAGLHCVSIKRINPISGGIGAGIHMKYAVESVIEGVESSQSMGSHILV
ncbi:MAG: glycosyl hydrolase family 28-related protein, partial [Bacteroidota bacterium]